MRTYSELIKLPTFKERFDYLKLGGAVGEETFGSDRYLNQKFYTSEAWRKLRNQIIIRDNGCDLGLEGNTIYGKVMIHHLNPISSDELIHGSMSLMDPENLVCVSYETHNAIHYGDYELVKKDIVERKPGDTCPWK